jgi:uncharacterized membrane protein YcaP (DUF421 family)
MGDIQEAIVERDGSISIIKGEKGNQEEAKNVAPARNAA